MLLYDFYILRFEVIRAKKAQEEFSWFYHEFVRDRPGRSLPTKIFFVSSGHKGVLLVLEC